MCFILGKKMERAIHDEHATESTTQNYKSQHPLHHWILQVSFYMCHREEGLEINCMGHFLTSCGPP